jgi:hypothetical protein
MYEVQIFRNETKLGLHHQFYGLLPIMQQTLPNAEGSGARYSNRTIQKVTQTKTS